MPYVLAPSGAALCGRPSPSDRHTLHDLPGPVPVEVWLAYALASGISARQRRELLARSASARELGHNLQRGLAGQLTGWPRAIRDALTASNTQQQCAAALAWQQADPRHHFIGLDDPHYPESLLATDDPPPLLYLRGRIDALQGPQVAIVGSRKATGPAIEQARRLAARLTRAGIGIVSGLALGIDTAAHRGALDGGGHTLAVLANAPDRIYPQANRSLASEITQGGLLITEFPLGSPLRPGCFPRRNRLISGLSLGVVVVEATLRSGSLITARHAADQGREVMAMPGSVANLQVRGCHELLRQGATLVESADDVLTALQPALARALHTAEGRQIDRQPPTTPVRGEAAPALPVATNPDALQLLGCLGHDSLTIDTLARRCGLPVVRVARALVHLELQVLVSADRDGRYARTSPELPEFENPAR